MLFALAAILAAVASVAALLCLMQQRRVGHDVQRLRLLAEQALAGTRGEAEATRLMVTDRVAGLRGAFDTGIEQVRTVLSREQGELRLALADGQQRTAEESADNSRPRAACLTPS